MKHEANFQITFNHWLKTVYKKTCVCELKQTQTNYLLFSAVKPHQIDALVNVRHNMFVFKIPDVGYQNPYDCFSMYQEPAYVVIKYPKFFCLISIDTFLLEKEQSKRKSLSSERAREISVKVVSI